MNKLLNLFSFNFALREGFNPFGSSYVEYAASRDRSHAFDGVGVATQNSFHAIASCARRARSNQGAI